VSKAVLGRLWRARAAVPGFLDWCLEKIIAARPRVVGFTSVFHQHVASLALAQRLERALPGCFVVMGGAVGSHGNALPAGEANVAHDPAGADRVVRAAWPDPPLLVGLDVTHRATLSAREWEVLERRANPAAEFLAEPLAFCRRYGSSLTPTGESPCHDLLAVMAVAWPDLITAPVLPLAVVTTPGPAWGATIADHRQPYFSRAGDGADQELPDGFAPWRIGTDVDVERFRAEVRHLFAG
jgi:purine nucleosidase